VGLDVLAGSEVGGHVGRLYEDSTQLLIAERRERGFAGGSSAGGNEQATCWRNSWDQQSAVPLRRAGRDLQLGACGWGFGGSALLPRRRCGSLAILGADITGRLQGHHGEHYSQYDR